MKLTLKGYWKRPTAWSIQRNSSKNLQTWIWNWEDTIIDTQNLLSKWNHIVDAHVSCWAHQELKHGSVDQKRWVEHMWWNSIMRRVQQIWCTYKSIKHLEIKNSDIFIYMHRNRKFTTVRRRDEANRFAEEFWLLGKAQLFDCQASSTVSSDVCSFCFRQMHFENFVAVVYSVAILFYIEKRRAWHSSTELTQDVYIRPRLIYKASNTPDGTGINENKGI